MTALGDMRERITLMREEKTQGAGGRLMLATPIIADVWAAVEEGQSSLETYASRQEMGARATFRTHEADGYADTRRIAWQGRTFRVDASRRFGAMRSLIEFSSREILA